MRCSGTLSKRTRASALEALHPEPAAASIRPTGGSSAARDGAAEPARGRGLPCWNLSKIKSSSAPAGMPIPLSPDGEAQARRRRPPRHGRRPARSSAELMALAIRLAATWRRRSASPRPRPPAPASATSTLNAHTLVVGDGRVEGLQRSEPGRSLENAPATPQRQVACLDLGQVEDVVDDGPAGPRWNGWIHRSSRWRWSDDRGLSSHHLGHGEDAVQRGADFVADGGSGYTDFGRWPRWPRRARGRVDQSGLQPATGPPAVEIEQQRRADPDQDRQQGHRDQVRPGGRRRPGDPRAAARPCGWSAPPMPSPLSGRDAAAPCPAADVIAQALQERPVDRLAGDDDRLIAAPPAHRAEVAAATWRVTRTAAVETDDIVGLDRPGDQPTDRCYRPLNGGWWASGLVDR